MNEAFSRAVVLASSCQRPLAVALQLGLIVLSNYLAFMLRFDGDLPDWAWESFWLTLPSLAAIRALTFVPFRLYEGVWRYTSLYDLRAIAGGVCASTALFYALNQTPLGPDVYPRSIYVVDALVLTLLLGGVRVLRRATAELPRGRRDKRVLIVGAGNTGELIVRDMKGSTAYDYRPIGFVDDNQDAVGQRIHGVPVLGTLKELPGILRRARPHEVLLALPDAEPAAVRAIVRALEPFKVPIKTLPNLRDLIDGRTELSQIRSLSVEDLLTRAPVGLDATPVKHLIAGRRVMVTGAGGSIGSELCRQIAKLKPACLVMFERYENSLHAIRLELEDRAGGFGLAPVIGDVTDPVRVDAVMQRYRPEIVFHAAAHKHVPLMEENPCEAIKNNVCGTRLLAEAADRCGVDRFIMISTDKAVNPTSVMGASKRLAELVVQSRADGSGTSFAVVRFGNVLGSNGSVVPRFLEQIRRGGPVTITHPEIRRFFMLIPEAVQLVLHAAAQAQSGATYVLEMGEQVKLLDMARDLIRLSGFVPDEEIAIEFIGLRPGEKLYEELVGRDEEVGPSAVEKILRVTSRSGPPAGFPPAVARIERAAAQGQEQAVRSELRALVGLSVEAPEPARDEPAAAPAEAAAEAAAQPRAAVPALDAAFAAPARGVAAAFAEVREGPVEQPCPRCDSPRLHRSRARTLVERVRRSHTAKRLFRCDDCSWRGWLIPLEFGDADAVHRPPAPDLTVLDAAVEGIQEPLRRTFSPRDLL